MNLTLFLWYSYFELSGKKNLHLTFPTGNMTYDQYTVPDTVAVEPTFVVSFSTRKHKSSIASRDILSNFFEEQWTQNHPEYLSGLSRALFPKTFLGIDVYNAILTTNPRNKVTILCVVDSP